MVTGTFEHLSNGNLINLFFKGESEPHGVYDFGFELLKSTNYHNTLNILTHAGM